MHKEVAHRPRRASLLKDGGQSADKGVGLGVGRQSGVQRLGKRERRVRYGSTARSAVSRKWSGESGSDLDFLLLSCSALKERDVPARWGAGAGRT